MIRTKRLIALLLCFVMLSLSLASCNEEVEEDDVVASTEELVDDTGYESIERYNPGTYEKKYFGISGSKYVLNLSYPRGWVFSTNKNGETVISRDGKNVGMICAGKATDTHDWTEIKSESSENDKLTTKMTLERSSSAPVSYRMRFEYSYKDTPNAKDTRIITLVSDYAELCDFTLNKMLLSQTLKSVSSDTIIGTLDDLSNASSIAILGNSFISTSNIGEILSEMFSRNGKRVSVNAVSRGYATVETYATDTQMISDIKRGKYDAVFLCGFYQADTSAHLDTIKAACDKSNTKLVVFPAHNEKIGGAKAAVQRYNTIGIISWKEEIDRLIAGGVSKWDFCYDDSHLHSTELAGYVGAHMIYRAMYGEVPSVGMSNTISQNYINSILGDYVKTAGATYLDSSQITYLK